MVTSGSDQIRFTRLGKLFGIFLAGLLIPVIGNATNSSASCIINIEDVQEASLVSISGGYEQGFRNGMKLVAYGNEGIKAELIVLEVTDSETQTLITELFGQSPLKLGNPVAIKTINFAATWK